MKKSTTACLKSKQHGGHRHHTPSPCDCFFVWFFFSSPLPLYLSDSSLSSCNTWLRPPRCLLCFFVKILSLYSHSLSLCWYVCTNVLVFTNKGNKRKREINKDKKTDRQREGIVFKVHSVSLHVVAEEMLVCKIMSSCIQQSGIYSQFFSRTLGWIPTFSSPSSCLARRGWGSGSYCLTKYESLSDKPEFTDMWLTRCDSLLSATMQA